MSAAVEADPLARAIRSALLRVPYEAIKTEAVTLGIEWRLLRGLTVTEFQDGTSVLFVRESDTEAVRLFDHLLERALVRTLDAREDSTPQP